MIRKGFGEEFVHEMDEVGSGSPGRVEGPCLFGTGNRSDDEVRVGTAESVDGLFDVADPNDALRTFCESGKEGELDGARVLEFIDDQQVDLAG